MTFDNHYLTYSEYLELGGTLEELPFNKLEYECERLIDSRTLNRLKDISTIPDEVKMCTFKLIETISFYQSSVSQTQNGIKSENIDGYSVSYLSSTEIDAVLKSKEDELQELISTYLFGVIVNDEHILYIGI